MKNLFSDKQKIRTLSEIQENLMLLTPNPTKEDIDKIINLIPSNMLTQKDDLMTVCQLFALYTRRVPIIKKKIGIELFSRIMPQLKALLQDESNFFWIILGGLNFFKLWLYQEGLISFDHIIISAEADGAGTVTEFFLPEIIEKDIEIYEKELKYIYTGSYTQESLFQYKILRVKYFKWIRFSGDFKDPSYLEIEQDKLRLSIKLDDIESFQKILSNSNLTVDSEIKESSLENKYIHASKVTLFEYATECNSVQIMKFLILNNVHIEPRCIYFAIENKNYEFIHFLESNLKEEFEQNSLLNSISAWNDEMVEYSLENFDHHYFQKSDVPSEKVKEIIDIFGETFFSSNFKFFESTLLPFMLNNEEFISKHIHEITERSFFDISGYLAIEFLKHPSIDINYHFKEKNITLLSKAILKKNTKIIGYLLKDPELDINTLAYNSMTAFHVACRYSIDIKAIKLLCNHPSIDINFRDSRFNVLGYQLLAPCGNFLALKYMIERFPDIDLHDYQPIFYQCFIRRHLLGIKIILKYIFENNEKLRGLKIMDNFKQSFSACPEYNENFLVELKQIIQELNIPL